MNTSEMSDETMDMLQEILTIFTKYEPDTTQAIGVLAILTTMLSSVSGEDISILLESVEATAIVFQEQNPH